jgi:SET domain-containing protein
MNAIFKNENIKFAKIGEEVIIRNAKIEVINGNIILISDENSNIFPSKGIIDINSMPIEVLELNYSKIKLQMWQFDNL